MSAVSDQSVDEKWNVYSASQNLAAVLNNPNKIKQVKRRSLCNRAVIEFLIMPSVCTVSLQKDFFTKLWGEAFIEISHVPDPQYLPTISKAHFEPYIRKLSKVKVVCVRILFLLHRLY